MEPKNQRKCCISNEQHQKHRISYDEADIGSMLLFCVDKMENCHQYDRMFLVKNQNHGRQLLINFISIDENNIHK